MGGKMREGTTGEKKGGWALWLKTKGALKVR